MAEEKLPDIIPLGGSNPIADEFETVFDPASGSTVVRRRSSRAGGAAGQGQQIVGKLDAIAQGVVRDWQGETKADLAGDFAKAFSLKQNLERLAPLTPDEEQELSTLKSTPPRVAYPSGPYMAPFNQGDLSLQRRTELERRKNAPSMVAQVDMELQRLATEIQEVQAILDRNQGVTAGAKKFNEADGFWAKTKAFARSPLDVSATKAAESAYTGAKISAISAGVAAGTIASGGTLALGSGLGLASAGAMTANEGYDQTLLEELIKIDPSIVNDPKGFLEAYKKNPADYRKAYEEAKSNALKSGLAQGTAEAATAGLLKFIPPAKTAVGRFLADQAGEQAEELSSLFAERGVQGQLPTGGELADTIFSTAAGTAAQNAVTSAGGYAIDKSGIKGAISEAMRPRLQVDLDTLIPLGQPGQEAQGAQPTAAPGIAPLQITPGSIVPFEQGGQQAAAPTSPTAQTELPDVIPLPATPTATAASASDQGLPTTPQAAQPQGQAQPQQTPAGPSPLSPIAQQAFPVGQTPRAPQGPQLTPAPAAQIPSPLAPQGAGAQTPRGGQGPQGPNPLAPQVAQTQAPQGQQAAGAQAPADVGSLFTPPAPAAPTQPTAQAGAPAGGLPQAGAQAPQAGALPAPGAQAGAPMPGAQPQGQTPQGRQRGISLAPPQPTTAAAPTSAPRNLTPQEQTAWANLERKAAELDRRREARRQQQGRNTNPDTRNRGPEQIAMRLINELRSGGTLTLQEANGALRIVEKLMENGYLDNLAVSVSNAQRGAGVRGDYNPVKELVQLFVRNTNRPGVFKRTFAHEVSHHLERMVPAKDLEAARQQFLRERAKWLSDKKGIRALLGDGNWLDRSFTNEQIRDFLAKNQMDPALISKYFIRDTNTGRWRIKLTDETYRYTNFSEYFAEKVAQIAGDRDDNRANNQANPGVWAKIRGMLAQIKKAMIEVFGRDEVEAIWDKFQQGEYSAEFQRDELQGYDKTGGQNPVQDNLTTADYRTPRVGPADAGRQGRVENIDKLEPNRPLSARDQAQVEDMRSTGEALLDQAAAEESAVGSRRDEQVDFDVVANDFKKSGKVAGATLYISSRMLEGATFEQAFGEVVEKYGKSFANFRDVVQETTKRIAGLPVSEAFKEAEKLASTRYPTAVDRLEDPNKRNLISGLATILADPQKTAKAAEELRKIVGFKQDPSWNDQQVINEFIKHVENNLDWLYKGMRDKLPDGVLERSMLWYVGANAIANRLAKKHSISVEAAAGVLAVLSPQMDWYKNVSLAERALEIVVNKKDHVVDQAMMEAVLKRPSMVKLFMAIHEAKLYGDQYKKKATKWPNKGDFKRDSEAAKALEKKLMAKAVPILRKAGVIPMGTKMGDIKDPRLFAYMLRAYDEAYNPREYMVITPEGDTAGPSMNDEQTETNDIGWGNFDIIEKVRPLVENPTMENISRLMGGEHKVRNFYNNIIAPNAKQGQVTIDTHAVAAALLEPLAGSDKEVGDNLGDTGGSNYTGLSGLYPIYAQAYQNAAKKYGLLPREMQSITWEGVRGLFTNKFKNATNKSKIKGIWADFAAGRRDLDSARAAIEEIAGGFKPPTWHGRDGQSAPGMGSAQDQGNVDPSGVREGRGRPGSRRTGSGSEGSAVNSARDEETYHAGKAREQRAQLNQLQSELKAKHAAVREAEGSGRGYDLMRLREARQALDTHYRKMDTLRRNIEENETFARAAEGSVESARDQGQNYEGLAFSESDVRRYLSSTPEERRAIFSSLPDKTNRDEFRIMAESIRQQDFDNRPGAEERRAKHEARRQEIVKKYEEQGHPNPELAADQELISPPTGRDPEEQLEDMRRRSSDRGRLNSARDDGENTPIPGGYREAFFKARQGAGAPEPKQIKFWTDLGHDPDADTTKQFLWSIDRRGQMHVISVSDLNDKMAAAGANDQGDVISGPSDGLSDWARIPTHLDWGNLAGEYDRTTGKDLGIPLDVLSGPAHGRIDATGDVVRVSLYQGNQSTPEIKADMQRHVKEKLGEALGQDPEGLRGYDFTDAGPFTGPEVFSARDEEGPSIPKPSRAGSFKAFNEMVTGREIPKPEGMPYPYNLKRFTTLAPASQTARKNLAGYHLVQQGSDLGPQGKDDTREFRVVSKELMPASDSPVHEYRILFRFEPSGPGSAAGAVTVLFTDEGGMNNATPEHVKIGLISELFERARQAGIKNIFVSRDYAGEIDPNELGLFGHVAKTEPEIIFNPDGDNYNNYGIDKKTAYSARDDEPSARKFVPVEKLFNEEPATAESLYSPTAKKNLPAGATMEFGPLNEPYGADRSYGTWENGVKEKGASAHKIYVRDSEGNVIAEANVIADTSHVFTKRPKYLDGKIQRKAPKLEEGWAMTVEMIAGESARAQVAIAAEAVERAKMAGATMVIVPFKGWDHREAVGQLIAKLEDTEEVKIDDEIDALNVVFKQNTPDYASEEDGDAAYGIRRDQVYSARDDEPVQASMSVEQRKARIEEIKQEITKITKGRLQLSREEGARYSKLGMELETHRFEMRAGRGLKLELIKPMQERGSAIPSEIVKIASDELASNRAAFDALTEASIGVRLNQDTAVDVIMNGENANVSPSDLYSAFDRTREALRRQFGDTIVLYRAHGKQKQKATQNWHSTEAGAREYGSNIERREIPVDDVIAMNVGLRGAYEEFIVGKKPGSVDQNTALSARDEEGDYRGSHRAPDGTNGEGSLDAMDRTYPDDIYGPKGAQYYGARRADDVKIHKLIQSVRGKPDAMVTVYRAVPKGVATEITPGNWVTPSRDYAAEHGERFKDGFDIIERQVRAGDLFTEGNSLQEFGWNPTGESIQSARDEDGENTVIPGGKREEFLKKKPAARPQYYTEIGHDPANAENSYLFMVDSDGVMYVKRVSDLKAQITENYTLNEETGVYDVPGKTYGMDVNYLTHSDWEDVDNQFENGIIRQGSRDAIAFGRIEVKDGKPYIAVGGQGDVGSEIALNDGRREFRSIIRDAAQSAIDSGEISNVTQRAVGLDYSFVDGGDTGKPAVFSRRDEDTPVAGSRSGRAGLVAGAMALAPTTVQAATGAAKAGATIAGVAAGDLIGLATGIALTSTDRPLRGLNPIAANMHLLANDTKSPTMTRIANMFGLLGGNTSAGAQETYHDSRDSSRRIFRNKLAAAFEPLAKLSQDQIRALDVTIARALAGEIPMPSGAVGQVVQNLRALSDELYNHLREAGVDVNYAQDYAIPHSFNAEAVAKDEQAFIDKAEQAYIRNNPERIRTLTGYIAQIAAEAKANGWTSEMRDRSAALQAEIDKLRNANPRQQAEDLAAAILSGEEGGDQSQGLILGSNPQNQNKADFLKSRVFESAARAMLREYFHNDARHAWNNYIARATTISEFTRRFGKDGEKWNKMVEQLRAEKVSNEDITRIKELVLDAMGALTPAARGGHAMANALLGLSNMSKLKSTFLTNFLEAQAQAIPGGLLDTVTAPVVMLKEFAAVLAELSPRQRALLKRLIRIDLNTETGNMELARIVGLMDASGVHQIMENSAYNLDRSSDFREDSRTDRAARGVSNVTSGLARAYGIEASENAKRAMGARYASGRLDQYVSELIRDNIIARALAKVGYTKDTFTTKNEARMRLRRAGVSDADMAAFTQWWEKARASGKFNEMLADSTDPMAAMARRAIRMESSRAMVNSNRAMKPGGERNKAISQDNFWGKAVMSFLNYPAAFREQVAKPMGRDIRSGVRGFESEGGESTFFSPAERARMIAKVAAIPAMAVSAAAFLALRTMVNGDDEDKEELQQKSLFSQLIDGLSYTGFLGGKTEAVQRARRGQLPPIVDEAVRLGKNLERESTKSNGKERAVTKSVTRSIGVPALQVAATTTLPMPLATVVDQALASKAFTDFVVDTVAGPGKPKSTGYTGSGRESGRETGRSGSRSDGR